MGTLNMLGLAKRTKARFLISSTSGMCHLLSRAQWCSDASQRCMVTQKFTLSTRTSTCVLKIPFHHTNPARSWGHVNPIGPRACYDEGKRVAETLTYGFHRQDGVDVRVVRIFNTYGPRSAYKTYIHAYIPLILHQ